MIMHMQSSADLSASSQGGAKPGLASLMRRAVNQARAEAAAQAASQDPAGIGLSSDVKEEPKAAPDGKKALAAMLRKAAQKMQQEEGALAADSGQMVDSQRAPVAPPTGKKALGAMLKRAAQKMQEKETQPGSESLPTAALLDDTVQKTDSIQQPVTTQQQALHEEIQRLTAVFESERSGTGTLALDVDNVHLSGLSHASSSDSARGLLPTSLDRRPIRHQSLGQRLGSILKGTLSLQKQSGYMAIDGDEPLQHPEPPPGRRRALPRDASYLPEWLNQTLGLSSSSDGNLTPAAGDAFAALGNAASGPGETNELVGIDDDNALPQWVDWSALKPHQSVAALHPLPCPSLTPTMMPPLSTIQLPQLPLPKASSYSTSGSRSQLLQHFLRMSHWHPPCCQCMSDGACPRPTAPLILGLINRSLRQQSLCSTGLHWELRHRTPDRLKLRDHTQPQGCVPEH